MSWFLRGEKGVKELARRQRRKLHLLNFMRKYVHVQVNSFCSAHTRLRCQWNRWRRTLRWLKILLWNIETTALTTRFPIPSGSRNQKVFYSVSRIRSAAPGGQVFALSSDKHLSMLKFSAPDYQIINSRTTYWQLDICRSSFSCKRSLESADILSQ